MRFQASPAYAWVSSQPLDRMSNFATIVSSVCSTRALNAELRACPDIYVSSAVELLSPDEMNFRKPADLRPDQRCVILVLESPHKAEFKGKPSPAKGTTGRLIAENLHKVLGAEEAALPLILVNAVPYQCSLGEVPSLCRDAVFTAYWEHAGRDQFVQRLGKIYRPGDIMVCACTRGNISTPKNQLRQRVWEAMCSLKLDSDIHRRNHPCTWNIGRNRAHVWNAA